MVPYVVSLEIIPLPMAPIPAQPQSNDLPSDNSKSYQAALFLANQELALQLIEREKRAEELALANIELDFQNCEKQKRADELAIANIELDFQNMEKQHRADELATANRHLEFQLEEKELRAAELLIANKELAFQNKEKENRARELVIANQELAYQNAEKEKRAAELLAANRELESFAYISSHHLQEPLRKIQIFTGRILEDEYGNLSSKGKYYIERTNLSAKHMRTLIDDIISYSGINAGERKFVTTDFKKIVDQALGLLQKEIESSGALIEVSDSCEIAVIPNQFRQLLCNLVSNSIKFSRPGIPPQVVIRCSPATRAGFLHLSVTDNGIGFSMEFKEKIFEIFQKLHEKTEYEGAGIGLTIVKKVAENHGGTVEAQSTVGSGSTFDILIPAVQLRESI